MQQSRSLAAWSFPTPSTPNALKKVTVEELLADLIAFGYEAAAATFVVDALRGREDPID